MDAVEEIKARLNIEDVVSRYVELKRAGRNFKGLSPFGSEKTPSFMVSPEKQIWHDFSSGKGGTMFGFIMEVEGVDFKGAIEILARQAGVDLAAFRPEASGKRMQEKERLYAVLDLAAKFYQVQFSKYRPAWEYVLGKRQFTKQTALDFRLGYSPESGTALSSFLSQKGYTQNEMKAAGLATNRYERWYDMFRGRIMVPLMDQQGRVIGFTARLLNDDPNAPKYINTPQTVLYDKSRHVFGLHLAKEAIRRVNYAVVVEGNLDVIASHQAGVKQVVATAGTAMTEAHLKALGRFTPDIRVAFDQDAAGLAATERTIPLASKTEVSLSIIDIPAGKDPDELVRKDPGAWQKVIEKPQYAPDWVISQYQKRLDLTTGVGKRQFSDVVLKVVRSLADPVERGHYVSKMADILSVSADALRQKLARPATTVLSRTDAPVARQPSQAARLDDKSLREQRKAQNHLLALAVHNPELRSYLQAITKDILLDEEGRKMYEYLLKHPDFTLGKTKPPASIRDFANILVVLYEELYQGLELNELQYEATRMQARLVEYYVKTQKAALAEALRSSDDATAQALLEKVKQLDVLLKNK